MIKGDISNEVQPRFLFVWDDLVGYLPSAAAKARETTARRAHLWRTAVNCWEVRAEIEKHLLDLAWRHHMPVDLVTYRPRGFAEALRDRLDQENLPFGHVYSYTAQVLAQKLVYMPYIYRVFHGDDKNIFKYGAQGRIVRHNGIGFSPLA